MNMPNSAPYDKLLPPDVALRSSFWFGRDRNYPIFSPMWFRHRSHSVLLVMALLFVVFCIVPTAGQGMSWPDRLAYSAMIVASLGSFGLVGPRMAVWVRSQAWPDGKELMCLVLALLLGALASVAIYKAGDLVLTASGVEARREERIAAVKAAPEAPAAVATAAAPPVPRAMARDKVLSIVTVAVIWLAGGVDLVFYLLQRRRLRESLQRQQLVQAQELRREAEMKLAVLAAQIEPHFLFNTLAGVRSAINVDPQRATAIVDHLVDYLRATIPQMRGDGAQVQTSLTSQLDAARSYLALMQARIGRLSFAVQADDGLERAAIPPLLLISLVENAIKHGIEPKIGPARVTVHARLAAGNASRLELIVSDDGVGFGGTTSGSGIGLANIRERLEALYGDQAGLTLKAIATGGVAAIIHLPLSQF